MSTLSNRDRASSANALVLMLAFLLISLPACENRSPVEIEFNQFVSRHPILNNPPSYEFRSIMIQGPSPKFFTTNWGWVDGPFSFFHVDQGFHESDLFKVETPITPEAYLDALAQFQDHEEFDWINGRNKTYSFGVKPAESRFKVLGLEMVTADSSHSNSAFPFALIYDNCMVKDLASLYEIRQFTKSDHPEFPNCKICRLERKGEDDLNDLFLDESDGKCMGMIYRSKPDEVITGKHVFRYRDLDGKSVPLAEETWFPDEDGNLELTRMMVYFRWREASGFDKDVCYLKYYGLSEPPIEGASSRWRPLLLLVVFVGIVVAGTLSWRYFTGTLIRSG